MGQRGENGGNLWDTLDQADTMFTAALTNCLQIQKRNSSFLGNVNPDITILVHLRCFDVCMFTCLQLSSKGTSHSTAVHTEVIVCSETVTI